MVRIETVYNLDINLKNTSRTLLERNIIVRFKKVYLSRDKVVLSYK